jgi:hypothetical protein
MVATLKPYRVGLVGLIVGASMLFSSSNAYAETAFTTVTCQNLQGEQVQRQIGWDNSNQYFADKGNIPQHYCEGGFAGPYTIYIGDDLPADSPLRWYAGIAPTPSPTPEPSTTIEPTPMPSPVVSLEPSPTPTLEQSPEPTPEPTQIPEPLPSPTLIEPIPAPVEQPTQLPTPTPEPTQTESPEPTPVPVVETPEPTAEPLPTPIPSIEPTPTPSLDPQEVTLEVPTQLLAIPGFEELAKSVEAIMNIGSDMTPEQREESQAVVISAVLVSQIATSIRRIK